MSTDQIRLRARAFERRIRLRNVREYVAAAFVIAAFAYFGLSAPEPLVQFGAALVCAGALFVCWNLHRNTAPAAGAETHAVAWADRHRAELVRQRDALRTVWRWYLAPFAPGMLVFLAGVAFTRANGLPLAANIVVSLVAIALVGAVFAFVGRLNARAADALDREIEKLDALR